MRRFDVLSLDCPLIGRRLLEASAGTGKTFAMEHIFSRLILEGGCCLEDILAVTFTRAATRDLKARIRANLQRIENILKGQEENPFPYLQIHIGKAPSLRAIHDALLMFDRAHIFTIHGFCSAMLQEFVFPLANSRETRYLQEEARLFLQNPIDPAILCPEQIALLLNKYGSLDDIAEALLKSRQDPPTPFHASWSLFSQTLASLPPVQLPLFLEDFASLRTQYKGYKEEFSSQAEDLGRAMQNPHDPSFFRKLIYAKGSLFSFVAPENRKVRCKEITLHYPLFFDRIGPIVETAVALPNIMANLVFLWKQEEEKLFDKGIFAPDAILSKMQKAMNEESFCAQVGRRFKAVMIDEFQDTDPVQWDIFQKAFFASPDCETIYLVGDPKQSIYRFRKADVYTYFAAKELLGRDAVFSLDTNYRSSKELISALNALFARPWLSLPKIGAHMEYLPVQAGLSLSSDLGDGKGALHWIMNAEDEEALFAYTAQEIGALQRRGECSIAILMKDRYEIERMGRVLKARNIAFFAKSHETLGESFVFRALRDLVSALASQGEASPDTRIKQGPFAYCCDKGLLYWRHQLETEGISSLFHGCSSDLDPIVEALLEWEHQEGFSWEGLIRFLDRFERNKEETKCEEAVDGAVELMTLHASKGLEFDVVFALGVGSPSSESEDTEETAEKLRQLYVAMTRAKLRLYVPSPRASSSKKPSPISLFASHFEGSFHDYLEQLSVKESVSLCAITPCNAVLSNESSDNTPSSQISFPPLSYTPVYIQSFSSLAPEVASEKKIAPTSLPYGKEVGQEIHALLEAIFASSDAVWQDETRLESFVAKRLSTSFLAPWESEVQSIVQDALLHPLFNTSFCLKQLSREEVRPEIEFFYLNGSHFMKGFIDLIFVHQGKLYFLDWKTNVLQGETPQEAMQRHHYDLQASLYREALERATGQTLGGAFYAFIREKQWFFINF